MAEKKTSRKTVKMEGPTIDSVPIVYRHKIPVGRVVKYFDGLREGRIYTTRCKNCGAVYYPPSLRRRRVSRRLLLDGLPGAAHRSGLPTVARGSLPYGSRDPRVTSKGVGD
jgi:hypothetical protein